MFIFIVPSYNNSIWIQRNLDSIFNQTYSNYRVIYIDDCSTDDTYQKVIDYIRFNNLFKKINIIRNTQRMYQTYNRYMAYHLCDNQDICCMVDGDDWLLHKDVLTILDQVYSNEDILSTFGQFMVSDQVHGCLDYPIDIKKRRAYRQYPFLAYHLRTGYGYLFKAIPRKYLQLNGEWLNRCSDVAEMLCVLELSGAKTKNVGQPLYVYNRSHVEDNYIREEIEKEIRRREPCQL